MIENLTTLKTAITNKLKAIDGLALVYGYEKGELAQYPAAAIYAVDYNPAYLDTTADRDVIVFTIRIYQEINAQSPENAEEIVDNLVVKIVQAFQQDYTLGGACDKITISANKGWVSREAQNRAATITITTERLSRII
jgi:hypothetical protein